LVAFASLGALAACAPDPSPTNQTGQNDQTPFATPTPDFGVTKTHAENFYPGQIGHYTVTVSNRGDQATAGTITVKEHLPPGLAPISMAGTGWTCAADGQSCTRADSLAANGASYAPITVTVSVLPNATSPQVNTVVVSGGGASDAGASDTTAITAVPKDYGTGAIIEGPGNLPALDDAGDTLVVGSYGGNEANVFTRTAGVWSRAAVLDLPISSPTGIVAVAISGDGKTVAMGNCNDNVCVGTIYAYVAPNGDWTQAQFQMPPTGSLTPSSYGAGRRFGESLAIDRIGHTIAVGSPCDYTTGYTLCGWVYVFLATGVNDWQGARTGENAILQIATTDAANGTLGLSVAIDSAGDTIVAGLPGTETGTAIGAAYVFTKGMEWVDTTSPTATLTASQASDPVSGDWLGWSVAISGDGTTVVAGAPLHRHCAPGPCNSYGPGAAYVFKQQNGTWASSGETSVLTASGGQNGDLFGLSTSINFAGDTIVVGAPGAGGGPAPPGAAYVFESLAQTQSLAAYSGTVVGDAITPQEHFGGGGSVGYQRGVSLSSGGSTLAIGGLGTVNTTPSTPLVWVFQ
jgi:uncharacterized repeat protein (TIGR01451 family)